MSIRTEAQKDQDQLEREIAEQRAHLGETISALEQRFSPGQMLDQVLAYGKENGGEFAQNLVNTIKNNPVPTLLTAIGVAWMMYGSSRGSARRSSANFYGPDYDEQVSASYGLDPDYDSSIHDGSFSSRVKEQSNHLKEKASDAKNNIKNSLRGARRTGGQWRHNVGHAGQEIRHQAHRASDGFQHLLKEQPLAVGAMGLALGAVIGGSLPSSRTEDKLMGNTRDRVVGKAKATAGDAAREMEDTAKIMKEDFSSGFPPSRPDNSSKLNS